MKKEQKQHFLIVTLPVQSHVNPVLEFAERLLRTGAHVTLVTSVFGKRNAERRKLYDGLRIATFSDGNDDGNRTSDGDPLEYLSKFRKSGSKVLGEVYDKSRDERKQVTYLVYSLLLPWVAEVAREYHVPSALLWIQPALVFDVYYYYFRGYGDVIRDCENNPSWSLKLPNLQFTFKNCDLPSFLLPSTPLLYTFGTVMIEKHIEELEKEETPTILVNTFEALEVDALKAVERFTLIPVGPLLPLRTLEGRDPSDDRLSSTGDLRDEDYMKWLDSQEEFEVIYVSFGSISVLSGTQQEELARALIQTNRPFMWVIREKQKKGKEDEHKNNDEDELSCMEELKQLGKIVPWCSQVEVLSHPSVGCFVTHCGWNSTLESITAGVPMVAFPQWTDQMTNAKLVEDVWKIGVRVKKCEEEGLVKADEINRCLEAVMKSKEMTENAKNLMKLTVQAVKQGGSSYKNMKDFINNVN
ncbi:hypothetical protein RND81_14G048500 [Saponaria officinalis]|uniref:Glycosyltransferase n=1 Tax=Saponaria officinalis TaxID=3572 RepID=A0AAW1GLG8_SAPOF